MSLAAQEAKENAVVAGREEEMPASATPALARETEPELTLSPDGPSILSALDANEAAEIVDTIREEMSASATPAPAKEIHSPLMTALDAEMAGQGEEMSVSATTAEETEPALIKALDAREDAEFVV